LASKRAHHSCGDPAQKGQHEEALASALAATKANLDSGNGWWQVALFRLALGDSRNAVPLWNGP